MFGFGDTDDEQRLWNLAIFNLYTTDKEIEEISENPGCLIAAGILIVVGIIGIIIF